MLLLVTSSLICLYIGFRLGKHKKLNSNSYIQNEAELEVIKELKKLDKNKYYVMNDITLPTEEGTTQIDHIVFSENGIFVIETKGHKGWIFGKENDRNWTQYLKGGRKFSFHSPIIQNRNHIKNIINITNIPEHTLKTIVVFTNDKMEFKTSLPKHVLKINQLIQYIEEWNLSILNHSKMLETIGLIEFKRKEKSDETNKEHIEYINKRLSPKRKMKNN